MNTLILAATSANAYSWGVAGAGKDGVYRSQKVSVSIDTDLSGNLYAAPYPVYHEVKPNSGFSIPLVSGTFAGYGDVASLPDGAKPNDFATSFPNLKQWKMTVKDGASQVATCSGSVNTNNCNMGNWCNVPCDTELKRDECAQLGWPEGCGSEMPDGSQAYWAGESFVKKCKGADPMHDSNACFSNDPSCCSGNQEYAGGQFCDTIWLECGGSPTPGKEYDVQIEVLGHSPYWSSNPESDLSMTGSITTKFVLEGEEQAYVGTYSCKQPLDGDSDNQICGSDPNQWEFKQHPMFHYNEYNFEYPTESNDEYIVGAYWTEWAAYKRFTRETVNGVHSPQRRYYAQNSPFHQLTHVLYAFVPICGNGPDGEGQLALCAVNDCASEEAEDLKFGNPYFNLRARACKFDANGNEASTAAGTNLDSDFELALHDPWSAFHIGGGQLLAIESVKKQYPDLKILPSIGGWTLSKMFYYLDEPANRAKFVDSCEKFLRTWKVFDGIDIDWEFPGGGGQDDGLNHDVLDWPMNSDAIVSMTQHKKDGNLTKKSLTNVNMSTSKNTGEGNMHDAETYTVLMKDLKAMLTKLGSETGRDFELSSAVSAGAAKIAKVDYGSVAQEMDHIFIMSYDLDGAWSDKVGHQTNLYPHPDTAMDSCSGAAELIAAQGFPMNKLVMGAAMYGRGWQNIGEGTPSSFVDENGQTIEATNYFGATAGGGCEGDVETGVVDYSTIAARAPYCEYFYDTCAEAPLMNCGGQVYTYDDARSVAAKGKYVQEKGMGGIFAWVLDQDNGDILNAMHESVGHTVKSGTPILKQGGYPERSCEGGVPPPAPVVSTDAPVVPVVPTDAPVVPPAGDMKCCVKVAQIADHANCAGASENTCSHNACSWVPADSCVDAVYAGEGETVVVPTLAPTTSSTTTTTTKAPTTTSSTTTQKPITTTQKPIVTPAPTTTQKPIVNPPAGDCKDISVKCDALVTYNGVCKTGKEWSVSPPAMVSTLCPASCAAFDSSKTCDEWKNLN